jgi:hypothetical protein
MREDTMKSSLLLLTGIVALVLVGPIDASAVTINIFDGSPDESDPSGIVTAPPSQALVAQTTTLGETAARMFGSFTATALYIATNPLAPGATQRSIFNMNDPGDDGPRCCSDVLSITLTGIGPPMIQNMRVDLTFFSAAEGFGLDPLPGGVLSSEFVHFEAVDALGRSLDLTVNATSDVPGPIAGAGLPGLLLASGGLLAWWRRRKTARAGIAALSFAAAVAPSTDHLRN